MLKNYYDVLGLERGASAEDIKGAYLRLAMKYHPDRNKDKDAEERFKEVKEAYEVLSGQRKSPGYDADALAEAFAGMHQDLDDIMTMLREMNQDLKSMNETLDSMNEGLAATTKRMREERIWRSRKRREETIRESSKFREETSQKISDLQEETETGFSEASKRTSDAMASMIKWAVWMTVAVAIGVCVVVAGLLALFLS